MHEPTAPLSADFGPTIRSRGHEFPSLIVAEACGQADHAAGLERTVRLCECGHELAALDVEQCRRAPDRIQGRNPKRQRSQVRLGSVMLTSTNGKEPLGSIECHHAMTSVRKPICIMAGTTTKVGNDGSRCKRGNETAEEFSGHRGPLRSTAGEVLGNIVVRLGRRSGVIIHEEGP